MHVSSEKPAGKMDADCDLEVQLCVHGAFSSWRMEREVAGRRPWDRDAAQKGCCCCCCRDSAEDSGACTPLAPDITFPLTPTCAHVMTPRPSGAHADRTFSGILWLRISFHRTSL